MHPSAFHIGSFTVTWYGLMMAVAFVAGLWTASRRGRRDGFDPEMILDIGPWLIIGAILGARIVYVLTYWDTLMQNPLFPRAPWTEVFMVQRGGLVFYGGFFGAALAAILFAHFKKLPVWRLADLLSPSLALGYVFGRIGCFMNGCCHGAPCSLPWAVEFPINSYAGERQHALGLIGPDSSPLPVHPTQLYDSLFSLLLYVGLARLYRSKRFDGQVLAVYLIAYAVMRSVVESFRGDYTPKHLHGVLTPAHLISIAVFAAGLGIYLWRRRRGIRPATAFKQEKAQAKGPK